MRLELRTDGDTHLLLFHFLMASHVKCNDFHFAMTRVLLWFVHSRTSKHFLTIILTNLWTASLCWPWSKLVPVAETGGRSPALNSGPTNRQEKKEQKYLESCQKHILPFNTWHHLQYKSGIKLDYVFM